MQLTPHLLLNAYSQGIFPMADEDGTQVVRVTFPELPPYAVKRVSIDAAVDMLWDAAAPDSSRPGR